MIKSLVFQWKPPTPGWRNLAVMLLLGIIFIFFFVMLRTKRVFKVKRLPQIDALSEMAGRCKEMGKPFMCLPGGGEGQMAPANIAISRGLAEICAKNRASVDYVLQQKGGAVSPWLTDVTHQEYLVAGVPDLWDPLKNLHFIASGDAFRYHMLEWINTYNPGSVMSMKGGDGSFVDWTLLEESARLGAIGLLCAPDMRSMPESSLWDHSLWAEEIAAAAVYMSGDQKQTVTLICEDVLKYGIILFVLIGAVLIGMNIPLELTGIWG